MAAPHLNLPAGVTLINGALPRAQAAAQWTFIKINHFGIAAATPPHPLATAFADHGIVDFADLLAFTSAGIDQLTYEPNGDEVLIPRGMCGRIKVTISMFNDVSRQMGGSVDMRTIPSEYFDEYRVGFYNPLYPLGRRQVGMAAAAAGAAGHGAPAPVNPRPTPAENFTRGIKKDKDHYMDLKDEKNFDNFRRNVESTAHTHGTFNVLDPTYVPNPADVDAVALFRAEKNFMYTVFEKTLKTDKGASLVRQFEVDRDAQGIWRDLLAHQLTSTAGTLHKEKILAHLTTHRLSSSQWKGTMTSYIHHWKDQLRQYEALVHPAHPFDDAMKRTLLQSSLSMIPELDSVKSAFHLELAQGRAAPTFEAYCTLVETVATTIDSRNIKLSSKNHDIESLMINAHDHFDPSEPEAFFTAMIHDQDDDVHHDIDTPVEDLEIYRAKQTHSKPQSHQRFPQLSLDRETWAKIPKEFQDVWDKFPPNVKNIILTGTRKKGADQVLNRKAVDPKQFNPKKQVGWKPPYQSTNAHASEAAPDAEPTQENHTHDMSSQDTPDTLVDTSDELSDTLFINMAKSRIPPSDIRRVLSQASIKKPPPSPGPDTRNVSFHRFEAPQDDTTSFWNRLPHIHFFWILASFLLFLSTLLSPMTVLRQSQDSYIVSATKRTVHSARGALVDRGANGGIAGNDVKIISKTGRTINVTGINNHQLSNVPIGTVAAHAVSQRGECIIIMHQYAIHQTNRSIHSCVQLEHFKNQVEDRSLKAGGLQRITTLDGYVFPLDIIEGLPYLKMRIPSDEEYATLPHVVLTADVPFRYNSMDCTLSDKSDWYQNTSDWHEGLSDSPFTLTGEYKHMEQDYELDFHYLSDLDSIPYSDDIDINRAIHHVPLTRDCNVLRPYFLNVPAHVVQRTLDATTQFARHIEAGPEMYKTHRSPFPACNVRRRNEPVATDTVFSDVAAIDSGGIRHAQIFVGRKSLVVDIYGLKKQSHFVNALLDNIRQRGAMDTLISDSAALEISQRVMDVLRHLMIGSWQSTPYMQQQNFAERRWKDIKRLANWIMGYKGVPADCWLLALEYVADVMNLTAVESLNWRTPLECLTGQTPDTSILLLFVFFDKVYYTPDGKPSFPSGTTEEKG